MVPRRRHRSPVVILLGAVAMSGQAWAASCDQAKPQSAVSFRKMIQPIFDEACTLCHIGGDAPESLVLEDGFAFDFLVNVPSRESKMKRVEPGSPENSYIVHKLQGTHLEVGGDGNRMPVNHDPLTDAQIHLLMNWIRDCSPDN